MCKKQTALLHLSPNLSRPQQTLEQSRETDKSRIEKWELAAATQATSRWRCLLKALALDGKANFEDPTRTLANYKRMCRPKDMPRDDHTTCNRGAK
ncbi:hypothetical protein DPX39_000064800 [Trypanosoma brucei equiperdum]|uniref:Uncharacterized protein n=1 Tax=Trypanosoma brucei equiperdum TaxID=630700 RepID=A0A3L6KQX1_9TRYP|nr:hypothetical protein DPX39_000064800 [Trypanosoma brucei equiperdum]